MMWMGSTVRWTAPVVLGMGLSCAPVAQPNSRTGPGPGVPIRDRYAAARPTSVENVFRWQQQAANPALDIDPWEAFDIRQAQAWLMGSPGHRATILDPRRTAVGLGIEIDRARGAVYVVQDFTARSVDLEAPILAWRRSPTPLSGRVLADGLRPLLVVLRRERHPRPWEGGNRPPPRGSYPDGSGESVILPPWAIQWNPTGRSFAAHLPIGRESEPELYYGIVYVAPDRVVLDALFERSVSTGEGWPGAAFVVTVL